MTLLELSDVSFGIDDKLVISRFSMSVPLGQFVCLIGPNGTGKTTLLRGILGLISQTSGSRVVCGKKNPKAEDLKGIVGYIPQRLSFDRSIPVLVEEILALKQNKTDPSNIEKLYSIFEIKPLLKRSLHELSSGEQQRVFLLFSMLSQPQLLLLDESFEGIDIRVQHAIMEELKRQVREKKLSVMLVSHDISAVTEWASRVVCLGPHVVYDGDPRVPEFHTCLHDVYGEKSLIHDHVH